MLRYSLTRRTSLHRIIQAVSTNQIKFDVDDIYKICVLLKQQEKEDTLGLTGNTAFLTAVKRNYVTLLKEKGDTALGSFQKSVVDAVLEKVQSDGKEASTSTAVEPTKAASTTPLSEEARSAMELVNALWNLYNTYDQEDNANASRSASDSQFIEECVHSLETKAKFLDPFDIVRLVKVLKLLHYHSHQDTVWLTRRCTLIANQIPVAELCPLFYNLHSIGCQDSLTAIVNQIMEHKNSLSPLDLEYIFRVLASHRNVTSSSSKLLDVVQQKGLNYLRQAEKCAYHRWFLSSLTFYNKRNPRNVMEIVKSAATRFGDSISEKDLLVFLSCSDADSVHGIEAHPDYRPTIQRLVEVLEAKVPTMSIHLFHEMLETVSVLGVDTSDIVTKAMVRLDKEAGKLSIPELEKVLYLLSSFPPAQGHVCIVSLAYTAVFRSEGMNAGNLQSILVSLAHLKFFTDDFYKLLFFLVKRKGGFKTMEDLQEFLELLDASCLTDARMESILTDAMVALATQMNDEDMLAVRRTLLSGGMNPKKVQEVMVRLKAAHRKFSGKRNYFTDDL